VRTSDASIVGASVATASLSSSSPSESAAAVRSPEWSLRSSFGALLVALSLPILFLHVRYQPGFDVGFGSTTATAYLSDIVVWVLVVTALVLGIRDRFSALHRGWWLWLTILMLFVWIAVSLAYGANRDGYPWHTHAVSAAKYLEYALLAPALPLLVRSRRDVELVLCALVGWTIVCDVIALLQFAGVSIFHAWPAGRRQPSLVGHSDYAALAGMTYCIGLVALWSPVGVRDRRVLAIVSLVAGGVGVVLAGATAGLAGIAAATIVVAVLALRDGRTRRALAVIGATVLVGFGVLGLRGGDYAQFLRFVGIASNEQSTTENVQTYSQRTLLAYIGLRIFQAHPASGVGYNGSSDYASYGPELPAAHRRFPNVAPLAFPARNRSYGVQNLYIQTLSDLGVVGGLLLAALVAVSLFVAVRLALARDAVAALALGWLLVTFALWTAQGYVAGIPLDATAWLAFGLVAVAARGLRDA
jgi:O-antigen ligase/polysaccharide polymerase Wzy-like membrane protein